MCGQIHCQKHSKILNFNKVQDQKADLDISDNDNDDIDGANPCIDERQLLTRFCYDNHKFIQLFYTNIIKDLDEQQTALRFYFIECITNAFIMSNQAEYM